MELERWADTAASVSPFFTVLVFAKGAVNRTGEAIDGRRCTDRQERGAEYRLMGYLKRYPIVWARPRAPWPDARL